MNLLNNKRKFKSSNLKELLDICLLNEIDYLKASLKDWLSDEEHNLSDYRERILEVGSLCSGTVYLENKKYILCGFILKRERKLYDDVSIDYLFVPVYVNGNVDYYIDPLIFQNVCNIYDDHGFIDDSFGNCMHLDTIIEPIDDVQKYVKTKKIDLNQYIKVNGLYLNI